MRANTLEEVFDDPHFKATGFFETRSLAGDAGDYIAMKPGLRFSKTPSTIRRDPPRLGQDTEGVLGPTA
jgi:crotonobetainyl-CoA:carnitine CoA-transferase CaiB-like acyl-CoA transferase